MPIVNPDLAFLEAALDPAAPPLARFEPSRALGNRYLQTIVPFLFRRGQALPIVRERWELPDGDFLDIDLAHPAGAPRGVAILLHGLEGSSRARYILGALERFHARGVLGVAVNFRTCSGAINRLPRAYHCGDSDDLRLVVARVLERWPRLPLGIVGISLGGNVLVKWLAEEGHAVPAALRGGVAVSVPWSLEAVARWNDRAPHVLVREVFLRTLRAKALAKAARFPGLLDPAAVRAATTFRAHDHDVTARLHGYSSGGEYWRRASSGPLVGAVRAPLLALAAQDDPIVPADAIPRSAIAKNPHITLETTPRGGHVGFVAGTPLKPRFFAEERAVEFICERIFEG